MSDTLYHYCSLNTFIKIIETKTLRLSEVEKSNDYMEMLWLKNKVIPRIIRQRFEKTFDESPVAFTLEGLTYRGVEGIIKMVEWFVDREHKDKMFESFSLACCFSEYGDLLSQWRGYADNAQGLSIGIDKDKIEKVFKIPSADEKDSLINFKKMIYLSEEEDFNVSQNESVVNLVYGFLKKLKNTNEDELHALIVEFLFSVSTLAPMYKNIAFSEENEWRAYICYPYPSGPNPDENLVKEFNQIFKQTYLEKSLFSELKSYVRNNKIIFYTEFNWENCGFVDFIKEIYIGSKCEADENDIKKLLASCNMRNIENINIIKSKCSYR